MIKGVRIHGVKSTNVHSVKYNTVNVFSLSEDNILCLESQKYHIADCKTLNLHNNSVDNGKQFVKAFLSPAQSPVILILGFFDRKIVF